MTLSMLKAKAKGQRWFGKDASLTFGGVTKFAFFCWNYNDDINNNSSLVRCEMRLLSLPVIYRTKIQDHRRTSHNRRLEVGRLRVPKVEGLVEVSKDYVWPGSGFSAS